MAISGTHVRVVSRSLDADTVKSRVTSHETNFSETLSRCATSVQPTRESVAPIVENSHSIDKVTTKKLALGLNQDQLSHFLDLSRRVKTEPLFPSKQAFSIDTMWASTSSAESNKKLALPNSSKLALNTPIPSTPDIRAFFATNPSEDQITEKAKTLGLNAAQYVEFQAIGLGMDVHNIYAPVLETMYVQAAKKLGEDIGGSECGGWTSYYSPNLGRAIAKDEILSFFASNPTKNQVLQKAAELGIGPSAVSNMMVGAGVASPERYREIYHQLDTSLFQGVDGYSLDDFGRVVRGGGHTEEISSDGATTWIRYS